MITSEVVPQSYFYFNYYESGLGYMADNKRSLKWCFNNGLSIALWFYMEELDTYESSQKKYFESLNLKKIF